MYAHAQMRYSNGDADSDFGIRKQLHHGLFATHPYAACPDVSLADKAAGRQRQITDHTEWDVLFVESENLQLQIQIQNT